MSMNLEPAKPFFAPIFACLVISACSNADKLETGAGFGDGETQQSQRSRESVFDVGGIEVVSHTSLSELPEAATEVEFTSTIIDSGNGPEICIGGVAESLPPQCSGPIIEDLVMGDWAETASRVSWGERTVVVSWPPNQNRKVTLYGDREAEERSSQFNDGFPLPGECVDLDWENTVDVEQLSYWADINPEIAGIAYFSRDFDALQQLSQEEKDQLISDQETAQAEELEAANTIGIGVLQVVRGNVEKAKDALTVDGKIPCITVVDNSMADLQKARDQIDSEELYRNVYMTDNSIGGVSNKFDVGVAVADISTVRTLAEKLENPSVLSVRGVAKILEGE